ncbi:MAG TPA: protein kinase [bacterium]|nr:protein kinase [bacterium]
MPDRSPRCENCGQKFSYGVEGAPKAPDSAASAPASVHQPAPVSTSSAVVPPPSPASGLSESIFEVSRGVFQTKVSSAPDPTVPARMALHDAADEAVIGLGDPIPVAEATDPEAAAASSLTHASSSAPAASAPVVIVPPPAGPAPAVSPDITVGKLLSGRLEIVSELGSGPLGQVFKAIDRKKGSVVAVKAIPAASLPEAALSGRFAETIALVKGLVHPNLVKVYGAGREGDTAFTIEQYLEGLPLRALLDVKRENGSYFTFEEAEPVVAQICQGLSFAHASLVHGGLKPENIVIHVDSLKISDLGLSRLFSASEWRDLQRKGKNGGAYLAPEYGDADAKIDKRADVYSVGAILYEMLTGRAPSGPDATPVSSVNPSVPRAVDRVIARAMSRRPQDRYESAGELKEAVLRVLGGDILAEDLESPVGELMETFVDDSEPENEPGIEIEYDGGSGKGPAAVDRESEATPVGAITVHEALWDPDEIAEKRTKSDSKSRKPIGALEAEPPANEGAAVARELFGKTEEPPRAPVPGSAAPTGLVTRPSDSSSRDTGLSGADHISIEVPIEEVSTSAEATAAGQGPVAVPVRAPDWLNVEGPKKNPGAEREFNMSEGSPLELELKSAPVVPEPADAPTTRRPSPEPPPPSEPRRPKPTPAPWDYRRGNPPVPVADRVADRPTDPPRGLPDRPTAPPRPRTDENPTARALSPAQPPVLDLAAEKPTDDQMRRPFTGPRVDPPFVEAPPRTPRVTRTGPAPALDFPTSAPRPTFVVRRSRSGGGAWLALLATLVIGGVGGGGYWLSQHPDIFSGFLPKPAGGHCATGMVYFNAGAFPLGSEKLDPDRDITEPIVHKASTEAFCIDQMEFPNKEGEMPAVNVTFAQAQTACAKEGKRLCSEEEWERACKGNDGTRFPYGDKFQAGVCNVGSTDKPNAPRASGTFPQCGRDDGLRDMSGNVWEMTASAWPDDANARVIKGGSAKLPAWGARCAYRDSVPVSKGADDVGFRCCSKPN